MFINELSDIEQLKISKVEKSIAMMMHFRVSMWRWGRKVERSILLRSSLPEMSTIIPLASVIASCTLIGLPKP